MKFWYNFMIVCLLLFFYWIQYIKQFILIFENIKVFFNKNVVKDICVKKKKCILFIFNEKFELEFLNFGEWRKDVYQQRYIVK